MKKSLVAILAICMMVVGLNVTGFAEEFPDDETTMYVNEEGFLMIEPQSQEEYDTIVAQIENNNKTVDELWEAAVAQAHAENSPIIVDDDTPQITPRVYANVGIDKSYMTPCGVFARIRFGATINREKAPGGYLMANKVYSINASAQDSGTSVATNHKKYTILDSGRTIACNFSMTLGVKQFGGSFAYYDRAAYVEIGASGKGGYVRM